MLLPKNSVPFEGLYSSSIVKWVLCTNISVIPQIQAPFHQINGTHAIFLSVILMLNMLSRITSKDHTFLFAYHI